MSAKQSSTVSADADAALALLPSSVRRTFLGKVLGTNALLAQDRDMTPGRVDASAVPLSHVAGSCALGEAPDADLTVRAVQRLYVADASAMPVLPRANTNIPTIMLAERAADLIRRA